MIIFCAASTIVNAVRMSDPRSRSWLTPPEGLARDRACPGDRRNARSTERSRHPIWVRASVESMASTVMPRIRCGPRSVTGCRRQSPRHRACDGSLEDVRATGAVQGACDAIHRPASCALRARISRRFEGDPCTVLEVDIATTRKESIARMPPGDPASAVRQTDSRQGVSARNRLGYRKRHLHVLAAPPTTQKSGRSQT